MLDSIFLYMGLFFIYRIIGCIIIQFHVILKISDLLKIILKTFKKSLSVRLCISDLCLLNITSESSTELFCINFFF